jgi:hypothetical protein
MSTAVHEISSRGYGEGDLQVMQAGHSFLDTRLDHDGVSDTQPRYRYEGGGPEAKGAEATQGGAALPDTLSIGPVLKSPTNPPLSDSRRRRCEPSRILSSSRRRFWASFQAGGVLDGLLASGEAKSASNPGNSKPHFTTSASAGIPRGPLRHLHHKQYFTSARATTLSDSQELLQTIPTIPSSKNVQVGHILCFWL